MLKFSEHLKQSENKKTKALLNHSLWGNQRFEAEALHIIDVKEFAAKFEAINGQKGKILLEHILWGKQVYECDKVKIINTEDKFGVVIKNHEIFMYKNDVQLAKVYDNMFMLFDSRLQITIIVNKM